MTSPSKNKRLDAVEVKLSPKEWAIRIVDDYLSYPSDRKFGEAAAKLPSPDALLSNRASLALKNQAEDRHPGNKPEDIRAYNKLNRALQTELSGLKELFVDVNAAVRKKVEVAGLRAALKLARLETIILQDAFGRTARKAAEWVQEYKTADAAEEESRQGMLKEFEAYTDVNFGEKWSDSVPLPGGGRLRFPSAIEDWIAEVVALAASVFAHRAAVQAVQDQHFNGHPILCRDVEADLDYAVKSLEDGIATFNAYLKTRDELFKGEWEAEEEEEDGIASAIPGEREGKLAINIDVIRGIAKKKEAEMIAAEWIKTAKKKAKQEILEVTDPYAAVAAEWDNFREVFGTKP